MQTLILTTFIILFGSAIFAAVEAALFSIPLSKVKVLVDKKKKGSASLNQIKENMQKPITVLVVFTNIFNIVGSMIIGILAAEKFNNAGVGIFSAAFTFVLIIFGEIIPKSLGENYAEFLSLRVARPLLFLTKIFAPLVWIIGKIISVVRKKKEIISEEEIRILSHLGHLEGAIEKDEEEMIQRVFKLNDFIARDIMTPRTVLSALDGSKTLGEIESVIYSLTHSRLPVYYENLDKIIGVCRQRELLIALGRDEKNRKISEFRHEVIFVPETMRVDELLPLFQKQKCHLAVVTDEFGGTSGVVTLEDVLEQLVGEIVDEKDKEVDTRIEAKKLKEKMLEKLDV